MNIAAAVILFHPDQNIVQRILSYLPYVQKLFVFDNTEGSENGRLSEQLRQSDKIVYVMDHENKGISVRLNQAANMSITAGFDWLLTMDQDSYFPENTIPSYFNCIINFPGKDVTAMFGVQMLAEKKGDICDHEEVSHLITSGSIVNLSLFKILGSFDEALFIDRVDHEYCLRARSKNYKIVRFNNIFMHHSLGTIKYGRSLKNFKITPRVIHSPVRLYYIVRNYFYLNEKYRMQFPEELNEMRRENWMRSKNNFLYGKNRFQLLRHIIKGYFDYKKGKMGKLRT